MKTTAMVIWDRDHGVDCADWYVRLYSEERGEVDSIPPWLDLPEDASDDELRAAAVRAAKWEGYSEPSEIEIRR